MEEVVRYPGMKPHKQLTYASKQLIAREVRKADIFSTYRWVNVSLKVTYIMLVFCDFINLTQVHIFTFGRLLLLTLSFTGF